MKRISEAIIALAALVSCGSHSANNTFDTIYYRPEYAGGFEIIGHKDSMSRVIRVLAPWQKADTAVMDLFIARNGEAPPPDFNGQVIHGNAGRIAAMSSSHIAMLDLVGETARIKAVSGMRFVSNSYILTHKDSIADIGNEADADFEALAAARPDIVLLYGINSASAMENRLRSLGIPYLYIGEHIEPNPLGRAEWTVAVAELTGCRRKGEEAFRRIAGKYDTLKALIPEGAPRSKVMLNTPYGDTWFMASPQSAMAAMIRDAGGEYVFEGNGGRLSVKSEAIDSEKAFLLVSESDFWLNAGNFKSTSRLAAAYPQFSKARCVTEGKVYNCDKRSVAGGGSDFWESGAVRPDLILQDLIAILHPEFSLTDSLYYYRRLRQ